MTAPAETFHLGRLYDLKAAKETKEPLDYPAADLTTHGVIVGMTGSGKTGLSIALLEEAALQGIPSIIVDLKGDLSNLLLNFPRPTADDLIPWIDTDEARRKETTVEELAAKRAEDWTKGLKASGITPEQCEKARDAVDRRIYTPGSEAGLPVSVVQKFAAPPKGTDRETMTQRIEATASAILGLTGVTGDPIQSREHILISNLLLNAWSHGRDLDLPHLISEVTTPPVRQIGAFDIDMFYPEAERLQFALKLNNLLASPTFSAWIHGEPLDIKAMLHTAEGKPRQSIFYLAHLDDSQRMFFLTLLLEEVVAWMRSQPGTGGLRAMVYIDELFGYLPPHPANPPSKRPLMTLLKQARAFGVGIMVATQNPVDIDYKALSNAGTWFIGKLQTERDKARLVEGLEGVTAEQGTLTDRSYIESAISSLGNRVFLMHDVHRDGGPVVFRTRWAMSYLYGPLTRDHVGELMRVHREKLAAEQPDAAETIEFHGADSPLGTVAPVMPPGLTQFFARPTAGDRPTSPTGGRVAMVYEARLLGVAEVLFASRKPKLEYRYTYRLVAEAPDDLNPTPWTDALALTAKLETDADDAAPMKSLWAQVPQALNMPKKLKELEKGFADFLVENAARSVLGNAPLGLVLAPEEDEENFRQRCRDEATRLAAAEADKDTKGLNAAQREKVHSKWSLKVNDIKTVHLTPKKTDVKVTHFGVVWVPYWWAETDGDVARTPAFKFEEVPEDSWQGNGVGDVNDEADEDEGE